MLFIKIVYNFGSQTYDFPHFYELFPYSSWTHHFSVSEVSNDKITAPILHIFLLIRNSKLIVEALRARELESHRGPFSHGSGSIQRNGLG